ncbi:MAG: maleylpyruvate isomerase family mycothiol-dependent enzyme [Carbonactinosporaceae bacterium]
MSDWNFMSPASKDNLLRVIRREAEEMFTTAADAAAWQAPTGAGHWQVRDVVGHMVDTTEEYLVSFDAARGRGDAKDPLGLTDMAKIADGAAQAFRDVPQEQLLDRLRADFDTMMGIFGELTEDEWAGLQVPHKYMGPLPAFFYPIFHLVDYAVHGWDIREGTGRAHAMASDAADLLVPLIFVLWQATANIPQGSEPFAVGVRVTSGHSAGDTRVAVSGDGLTFEPGSVDDLPAVLEFDPATAVLTSYGRTNGGTVRGDTQLAERFLNLFFRI